MLFALTCWVITINLFKMSAIRIIVLLSMFYTVKVFSQSPVTDKVVNEFYGFRVIKDEVSYADKTGDYVFYAEQDYIDFCNAAFGLDAKIPFVDFNTETVVIIFKKTPNGSNLFIDSTVETEKFIRLSVKVTAPLGTNSSALKNRCLIVKVKKSNKELSVVYL